jgi:hypothetical protein
VNNVAEHERDPMLVVASEFEMPRAQRVWGTGGWLPPEQREALDWLTLSRLLGWGVTVARWTSSGLEARLSGGSRWVVIACDPERLGEESIRYLASRLMTEPILVVARAGPVDSAFADLAGVATAPGRGGVGHVVSWIGPGPARSWHSREALDASALKLAKGTVPWARIDGAPLITARRVGRGIVATLSFHPSQARDADGTATALLKHLLIWGASAPVAWFDLERSLILRMDDPGGAQNVHHRSWAYSKLGEAEWGAIRSELRRRNARLSIGYVAGWVDDGATERGVVEVGGHSLPRIPGLIHPSPLVRYREHIGRTRGRLHDYQAEFRGIQGLRAAGLGDVELHGYTHIHPNGTSWAEAEDRYESTSWYRELGQAATASIAARAPNEHPLVLGIEAFRRYFSVRPTTLISPGDQWTDAVLERALELGLHLVSSYYLALRDRGRFCWTHHVCAPYLDEPDAAWFDAGLPVVGYFHDREPALEGVEWIGRWLDRWRAAGAQTLMDFRELASIVGCRLNIGERDSKLCLRITSEDAPELVRPLKIFVRVPERRLPSRLSMLCDDRELSVTIDVLGPGTGCVVHEPNSGLT